MDPNLKNKKKKIKPETPKEDRVLEPQPATSATLTSAEIDALAQEKAVKDRFSEKELEEIGMLFLSYSNPKSVCQTMLHKSVKI